jgi:hypothetical protein
MIQSAKKLMLNHVLTTPHTNVDTRFYVNWTSVDACVWDVLVTGFCCGALLAFVSLSQDHWRFRPGFLNPELEIMSLNS